MDLSKIKLFSDMEHKMSYHGARQSVLANNIANANTPGYKPLDIKKPDFNQMVGNSSSIGLKTTHSGHISTSASSTNSQFAVNVQKHTYETTPVGNEVVLEEQMLKMVQNSMDYQTTTSLYQKMVGLVSDAIGN